MDRIDLVFKSGGFLALISLVSLLTQGLETFGRYNSHGRETMGERDKLIIEKINLNEDVLETFG